MKNDYEWTSNTHGCVSGCIGRKIVGVLFNACPVSRRDLAAGNKTLVFDDGTGFTFSDSGTYWRESAEEIRQAVDVRKRELRATQSEIEGVLSVAGALDA